MLVESVFVAAGCNGETGALDCSTSGFVVYASGRNLFGHHVLDKNQAGRSKVSSFANGHTDHIHAVRIVKDTYVVTASADKTVRLWSLADRAVLETLTVPASAHYCDAILSEDGRGLFVFAATIDGKCYVWEWQQDAPARLIQQQDYGLQKITSLAAGTWLLPEGAEKRLVLAVALSDCHVQVYIQQTDRSTFDHVLALPGHSNWIQSMAWSPDATFLASTGPDRTVRLWRMRKDSVVAASGSLRELVARENTFVVKGTTYGIECETILYGHEASVHSVQWERGPASDEQCRLVSASADHTVIVWDGSKSILQLSIGETSLYSGHLIGDCVIAHTASGSIQTWKGSTPDSPVISGHFGPVEDVSWSVDGAYLLTVGRDQTSRVWACDAQCVWAEVARPQVHGYDLKRICSTGPASFLSAADEKVLRSFVAPGSFLKRLHHYTTGSKADEADSTKEAGPTHDASVFVPALGLSNKSSGPGNADASRSTPLDRPPTEADLARLTLWPETDKLYGHGNELFALAVSPCGRVAASACKATTAADAAVRFWWRADAHKKAEIDAHWTAVTVPVLAATLTVTDLHFSSDGQFLLCMSRDRSWIVCEIKQDGSGLEVALVQRQEEAHSRIIWTGRWLSSGHCFVTGARDHAVKTWQRDGGQWRCIDTMVFGESVHALAILCTQRGDLMAVGLEGGAVRFARQSGETWILLDTLLPPDNIPSLCINNLEWRPSPSSGGPHILAVVSADHSVRLYRVDHASS